MTQHEELLRTYIHSEAAPKGEWWLNVPVGFEFEKSAETMYNSLKEIDAVCLTSRPHRLPEEYLLEQSPAEFVSPASRAVKHVYRSLHAECNFVDERAILVEVKTDATDLKSIGQLTAYQELFEHDWGATVVEKVVVATSTDVAVEWVCSRLPITVVKFEE